MAATFQNNALVVRKKSQSTLLLIIKKKWVLGNFFSVDLPAVGEVITVNWRNARARDTIEISGWNSCNEPMGGFVVSESAEEKIKFTGMFYTTGCIILNGTPLENPAVFNNLIGVVNDKDKVLKEDYIGKLRATVTLDEKNGGYQWMLCEINEYFKKASNKVPDQNLPYKGVVGAVKQGANKLTNYITSRFFPRDVPFYTGTNVSPELIDGLLGREVSFVASKSTGPDGYSRAIGSIQPISANRLPITIYGSFFKIDVDVEYIGCTDEHGNTIVWSDQLEFMVDIHALFKNRAFGLYHIEAIRHHKKFEFSRWKVTKVCRCIEALDGSDAARSSRSSPCSSRHISKRWEDKNNRIRNHSVGNGWLMIISIVKPGSAKRTNTPPKIRSNHGSGVADVSEAEERSAHASPTCYRKEEPTPEKDMEANLRTCLHRCLESIKVRAAIKQADPQFFDSLVAALMSV
ncbi:hypothetical protein V3C99_016721 [Haemonchus contortus]